MAISDPLCLTALPLEVIDLDDRDLEQAIRAILDHYEVERVVVGLPIELSGQEGPAVEAARRFGTLIGEITGLPVVFSSEQFTTVEAERVLLEAGVRREDRREVRDKLAASVMLQAYLRSRQ